MPMSPGGLATCRSSELLRVDDLTTYLQAGGLPGQDPSIKAFLGIPISLRGAMVGNLYLGDDRPDRVFSDSEEIAARALASAAAVAIDNARLFESQRTSAKWMKASREIAAELLSPGRRRGRCSSSWTAHWS